MKNQTKTRIVSFLIIAVVVVWFFNINKSPNMYKATTISESWPIYTNNEFGFHVKYPDVYWSIDANHDSVSFTPDGSAFFGVVAIEGSIDSRIASIKNNTTGSCSVNKKTILINNLTTRKMTCEVGYFDSAGNSEETDLYVEKDGITYEISFTLGRGAHKNDGILKSKFNEMVGTFGFNQMESFDRVTYVDPRYNISIQYLKSWSFGTGSSPDIILHSPGGDIIRVYVAKNTSFDNLKQSQGDQISNCGPKKEYFINKNIGQMCEWLGYKTYFFEKNSNVYSITLDTLSNKKNDFDVILNSFTF